jgi:hypothetical protein
MRVALLLSLALAVPAAAQTPSATLAALRADFPADHSALAARLQGKSGEEARRIAYGGMQAFLKTHRQAILSAPGPLVIALEKRHGAMLRALGSRDAAACAAVGDRGFYSRAALERAYAPGIDDYGVALVAAARAGKGGPPPPSPSPADFTALMAKLAAITPGVPVRRMLEDRAFRARATPGQLCEGAAAMHEAAVALPGTQAQRMSRILLAAVIGVED